jgi:hypothetical protein
LEHDFDVVEEKNHVKSGTKWIKELIVKQKETWDFKQIVSDAEWAVRGIVNELRNEKGEKWEATWTNASRALSSKRVASRTNHPA